MNRKMIIVSVMSAIVGIINGMWIVFAGSASYDRYSPYYAIARIVLSESSRPIHELFNPDSGFQLVFVPLSGVLLGTLIGWAASRVVGKSTNSLLMKIGAIAGGISGFLSLGFILMCVYCS